MPFYTAPTSPTESEEAEEGFDVPLMFADGIFKQDLIKLLDNENNNKKVKKYIKDSSSNATTYDVLDKTYDDVLNKLRKETQQTYTQAEFKNLVNIVTNNMQGGRKKRHHKSNAKPKAKSKSKPMAKSKANSKKK